LKALFWIGLAVMLIGIALLFIPIPHNEREGVKLGGLSVGVETRHDEKLPPLVGAIIIVAGAGLMIAGKRKS
jgi:nucleoside recognition membrane protein YjiH